VLGIGLNAALDPRDLPVELRDVAGTLGRSPRELEAVLADLLRALEVWLGAAEVVGDLRTRDALRDRAVAWAGGAGVGAGIDDAGRLLVRRDDGEVVALEAGEVHLRTAAR
jgi:biotin-(acetyl-CoA carboxylase) ligase